MAFNPPNPDSKPEKPLARSLVQAERLMQIALVLPIAVLLGWFFGAALDRWLHQTWITAVGLVLGMVAGMLEAVRMALAAGNPKAGSTKGGSSGSRTP
jgi:F0F1-type ATP synthase assembly protein I